jgi:D-alanyl-D-alanine carboxypeptidase (penicillin-binding protein 5/6)
MVWAGAAVVLLLIVGYVVYALTRTVPAPKLAVVTPTRTFPGHPFSPPWPRQGEAAVGVQNVGIVGFHGSGGPSPIASVAKVMTAYVVLHDHPLHGNSGGPQITITPADVATYRSDLALGQSVVAVQAGEKLSERQALEALLLPSGNNIASLLAGWDAGSQHAFVDKMNAQAGAFHLANTHYADASGVDPSSASSAYDQAELAMHALKDHAFSAIVAMPEVTLPVAGRQFNVNSQLGQDGIVGVKTGTTSEAGGCFVFAATGKVAGKPVTIVGAVLRQGNGSSLPALLAPAFAASKKLIGSVRGSLKKVEVVHRGSTVGSVTAPWGSVPVTTAGSVTLTGWPGLTIHTKVTPVAGLAAPIAQGQVVGIETVSAAGQHATVRLVAASALSKPSLTWRLSHPS